MNQHSSATPSSHCSVPNSTSSVQLKNTFNADSEIGFRKLQCKPPAVGNLYECSNYISCVQAVESNSPSLGTAMLPSIVSAVLVVSGWFVVIRAQGNRERRKQIREHVVDLCADLDDLEALAIGYHSTSRDEAKEQDIISKLGRLEKACSKLPRFVENQKYFKAVHPTKLAFNAACMQVLRKQMTLNHFGDEHDEALDRQHDFILTLELAAVEVRDVLERLGINALD